MNKFRFNDIFSNQTAKILTEALPYIKFFQGKTIVIKYGGNIMIEQSIKDSFARDVILMELVGINPVIVHGGGPQINEVMNKIGKKSTFVDGMRVTDIDTIHIVEMVLGGLINKEIVHLINSLGGQAVGLTGKDGQLIRAKKMLNRKKMEEIDFGYVGEVESINPKIVKILESQNFIPVIAPIGVGKDGNTYNINADLVAGKLASTLCAEKLIFLTNTPGVFDEKGKLLNCIQINSIRDLIERGIITGGMIPKVDCALDAVSHGVNSALIIDGRVEHALLLELFTDEGIGTWIG